ncbi:ABC transporter permease [Bordetella sp. FB-8]|uniref:MlaE family ABC transporter permease n=1 Tax=Bordetella sp. FB-8 TaxID=1159870 RepID=UPI0003786F71|nr:ABC transporter permease [Bordetella sp. FB-8]
MPSASIPPVQPVRRDGGVCYLAGDWTAVALAEAGAVTYRRQELPPVGQDMDWDLLGVTRLDTVGAHLIWHAWGGKLPTRAHLSDRQRLVFQVLADHAGQAFAAPRQRVDRLEWLRKIGDMWGNAAENGRAMLVLFGQLVLDFLGLLARRWRVPWKPISAQVYHTGAQALGITALVGFLIGVVLSYLSAQQLRVFGADRFIVQLLGVSIVRELGPVLAAILVAGRSGSAITAEIGVMRVTQELDAMQVMGISHSRRLILPRAVALTISMPLLVLWTDALALLGGALAAKAQLNLSVMWFLRALPDAISMTNYGIGLLKGATFGALIALISCHFGLRIKANTESLGQGTTTSVVTSITAVILVDAMYAILFSSVGL